MKKLLIIILILCISLPIYAQTETNNVTIKFNPTGTQIYKGKLLIRLDFYPAKTFKTHSLQYIDVFARALTEAESEKVNGVLTERAKKLQKLVPTKKQLNPFLCHFISIDPNMTKEELTNYIEETFDKETLIKLDDILSVDNRKKELYSVLKDKFGKKNIRVKVNEINIEDINKRFANFKVDITVGEI